MQNKPKREKKKPKQLREAEKAHDANIYSEGYQHGYRMGIDEGLRRAKEDAMIEKAKLNMIYEATKDIWNEGG